jgi:predicted AlkP superfamily pyrophosphatase or phosphodiesterase
MKTLPPRSFAVALLLAVVVVSGCVRAVPRPGGFHAAPGTAAGQRPILILVSLDGFRWDYLARGATPTLARLAREGVRAEALVPVFPTKTFPSHYSIVTGLHAEQHGVVANTMEDPELPGRFSMGNREAVADGRWWGGEPIWVTAERQGQRTAPFFWPGSEAELAGIRPTYWVPFDGATSIEVRVDRVLDKLDLPGEERPTFLTLYFEDVDGAGHRFGPDSAEVREAMVRVDRGVGRLVRGLERRALLDRVHLVVVSDHGMSATSPDRQIYLDDYLDLSTVVLVDSNPLVGLSAKDGRHERIVEALRGRHPRMAVWSREEVPERLRYRDHRRIPPVIALADDGWSLDRRGRTRPADWRPGRGNHGYDNELRSMHGILIARGPAFRQGARVGRVHSVHLYALMAHLLELTPAPHDGSLDAVREMLSARE